MSAVEATRAETIGIWRHLALGDVGSTNTECLDHARAGDPGRLWITAERQLAGRGRRGRQWVSEAGNLYASLLLIEPAHDAAALSTLPLVVAVAVHRALAAELAAASAEKLSIKWPNDLLLDGAKVAGILLESEPLSDGRRAVVIGCGVNIAHAPAEASYPTATLNGQGIAATPETVFARLLAAMDEELAIWDGGRNVGPVLDAWRKRAAGIGRLIQVRLADRTLEGRFEGIDAAGRLVLQPYGGAALTISAGDVFF